MIEGVVEAACVGVADTTGNWISDAVSAIGGPDWGGKSDMGREKCDDPAEHRMADRYLDSRQMAYGDKTESVVMDTFLAPTDYTFAPPPMAAETGDKT
jgi:hypothetical protein